MSERLRENTHFSPVRAAFLSEPFLAVQRNESIVLTERKTRLNKPLGREFKNFCFLLKTSADFLI